MPRRDTLQGQIGADLNRWVRDEVRRMCQEMGLDEVPMTDPDFDFFEYTISRLKIKTRTRGADLAEKAQVLIGHLFFDIQKRSEDKRGVIYHYPKNYAEHKTPFDRYFKWGINQEINTQARERLYVKNKQNFVSIGEESNEISEGSLGGNYEDPAEAMHKREEERSLDQVHDYLLTQRRGPVLAFIWGLMRQGYGLQEIADALNEKAIEDVGTYGTPQGGMWGSGVIGRMKDRIIDLVRNHLGINAVATRRFKTSGRIVFRVKELHPSL